MGGLLGFGEHCVGCHFLIKTCAGPKPVALPATETDRADLAANRWGWLSTPPATISCHRGIWNEAVRDLPNRHEALTSVERSGACYFTPFQAGMELSAAMGLQQRKTNTPGARAVGLIALVLAVGAGVWLAVRRPSPREVPPPVVDVAIPAPHRPPAVRSVANTEAEVGPCSWNTPAGDNGPSGGFGGLSTREDCRETCRRGVCDSQGTMGNFHTICRWKAEAIVPFAPATAMSAVLPQEIIARYPTGCWSIVSGGGTGVKGRATEADCKDFCRQALGMNEANYQAHDWACVHEGRVIESRPAPRPAAVLPALPGEVDPNCASLPR